jgi:hypothetical protein
VEQSYDSAKHRHREKSNDQPARDSAYESVLREVLKNACHGIAYRSGSVTGSVSSRRGASNDLDSDFGAGTRAVA